jgi:hypothetical protein
MWTGVIRVTGESSSSDPERYVRLNTGVPHTARVWNYMLGGKDYYQVDREAGDRIVEANPDVVGLARASRGFIMRAVTHLAGEAGITQYLDIGTGLPTFNNTHEVAQRIRPEARIVYVDNDPLVMVHAQALLTGTPEGATSYIEADLRDPDTILREAANTLDFDRPIAIMLIAILHHIWDTDEVRNIVRTLVDAVPSGSYLAIAHALHSEAMDEGARRWNEVGTPPLVPRGIEEIADFFTGLDLVEPGLVTTPRWRPDSMDLGVIREVDQCAALGRKP